MTFDEILADASSMVTDKSAAGTLAIKKGIAAGLTRLRAKLKRTMTITTRKFVMLSGQAQYQMPENAIRIKSVHYISGGARTRLHYIDDENEWDAYIEQAGTTGTPTAFRQISTDIIQVYPAPSGDATGEISYQSRAKAPAYGDVTTGSVSVTRGTEVVQGSGTSWAKTIIGQSIKLESPNEDKTDYYRIVDVDTLNQIIYLENYYDGETETGKAYRIGYIPNIPSEYIPSISDYGLYYFYLWRKDQALAKEFQANFERSLGEISTDYSSESVSNVIPSKRARGGISFSDSYNRTRTL